MAFLHGDVYIASLHYPMSIMVIDPVCPQAILPTRVTLFPSGMLCSGGGRHFRVRGGGQTKLRGLLNRRRRLWEPRGTYFLARPVSTSGIRILGIKPIWGWANQFARAPESADHLGSRGVPIFLTCPVSTSGIPIWCAMLFLAFSTQFFLGTPSKFLCAK